MKTKFLLASLVASAVMVGCSNEELPVVDNATNDNLTLISEGIEGVDSRMEYDGTYGTFKWTVGDEIGVSRVSGKDVTTNYLFKAEKVSNDNTKPVTDPAWSNTLGDSRKYGYFTTEFGSIFKGNYVVYYPYDENFCEDGKIVAKLNVGQVEESATKTAHVASDGFMMSKAVSFAGGQKAEKFALYPVFGRLVVSIKTTNSSKIQTIVLRSLDGKTLPTELEIDADINVVNGKLNPAYMNVVEDSKVDEIVLAVDGNGTDNLAGSTDGSAYKAYFTLIPGTYTNFAIDVVTDKGTYTKTFASASIATGERVNVPLSFGSSDMVLKRTYYAASAASWKTAMDKIAASMTQSEAAPATIKVVNDIELNASYPFRPATAIHTLVPVTVVGEGSIKVLDGGMGTGALTNVTFNVPVKAEKFTTVASENVNFAAGLKADKMEITNTSSSYIINGGKIGKTDMTSAASGTSLTVKDVVFTAAVAIAQTNARSNNVTKVNFNNCTFRKGLKNMTGDITVNGASITHENSWETKSQLNVASGKVWMKGANIIDNVDVIGTLNILGDASATIDHTLSAITGDINVYENATLTLQSEIDYRLNGKIAVEGKLVNYGTLTANSAAQIDDMYQNNHKGTLENNGVVRVGKGAYDGVWYNNQNITFVNNANYNIVLAADTYSDANFRTYINKSDITGIEINNSDATSLAINLKGKGTSTSEIDFSGLNLILNASSGDITSAITDGLKWKNITVKGAHTVTFTGATDQAAVTTGNLNVTGNFTLGGTLYTDLAKLAATNITIGTTGVLSNGARASYTGTFTNNGTVAGGNPAKVQ